MPIPIITLPDEETVKAMVDERKHLEGLLTQRVHFLIVFTTVAIGASFTAPTPARQVVLGIGAFLAAFLTFLIYRVWYKLELAFTSLCHASGHPVQLIESKCKARITTRCKVGWIAGWGMPGCLVLVLAISFVYSVFAPGGADTAEDGTDTPKAVNAGDDARPPAQPSSEPGTPEPEASDTTAPTTMPDAAPPVTGEGTPEPEASDTRTPARKLAVSSTLSNRVTTEPP